jgi:hypothetical protein
MLSEKLLKTIYTVSATLRFNSERTQVLEKLLKKILLNEMEQVDLQDECKKIILSEESDIHAIYPSPEFFFKEEDTIFSLSIPVEDAIDYVNKRYFCPYREIFNKHYGFFPDAILVTEYVISEILYKKAQNIKFNPTIYKFKNKKEFGDLSFVVIPTKEYIESWSKISTFTEEEIVNKLLEQIPLENTDLLKEKVKDILNLISFSIAELKEQPELRFQQKPLLKINTYTYVLLTSHYFFKCLPQTYELLFRNCKQYKETKGKVFEKIVLDLLEKIPKSTINKNIHYDSFELDGLLNLENTSWFVECTSRPPSNRSLLGNSTAIKNDLEKSVLKCEEQAMRAIKNSNHPNIAKYSPQKRKGILILLEGIYPNQNSNTIFQFVPNKENLIRYAINYFDLKIILRQPTFETIFFEDFLLWRTQDNMPVFCFDEKDYWAYFINMKNDYTSRQAFEECKKKNIKIMYISERFNKKDYLSEMDFGSSGP